MAADPSLHAPDGANPIGRRVRARARVTLPATIETIDGSRRVNVRNLSAVGAMVEGTRFPGVGKNLVFKCFGIDAMGVVVWEEGDRCGIEFYDPIEDEEVVRQRQLSDDEFEQQKWRAKQGVLDAAARWSQGKSRC